MFQFTIRELLVLTALVAVGVAWRSESIARDRAHRETRRHAEQLRESLDLAKGELEAIAWAAKNPNAGMCWQFPRANWALIDQPIP